MECRTCPPPGHLSPDIFPLDTPPDPGHSPALTRRSDVRHRTSGRGSVQGEQSVGNCPDPLICSLRIASIAGLVAATLHATHVPHLTNSERLCRCQSSMTARQSVFRGPRECRTVDENTSLSFADRYSILFTTNTATRCTSWFIALSKWENIIIRSY